MYKKVTTVVNKTGIHARPASLFVNAAKGYASAITITNLSLNEEKNSANAKSIIKVLTLVLNKGSQIEISAEGEDEKEAVDALIALVDSGFGEED